MLSFKQVDNFNNITGPYNPRLPILRTTISPKGNFLLAYDSVNIHLFDLNDKRQIPIKINTTIYKAAFSLNESQIIFTNLIGISAYSYTNQTFSTIIREAKTNYISDFQINEDYTLLYFINGSNLASINLQTLVPINNGTSTHDCSAVKMKYDFNSQTIFTSSLKANQNICHICKWNIVNNTFVKAQSTILSFCVINNIQILNKQIIITKKKFNLGSWNTFILNFDTLSQVTQTTQQGSQNPAFVIPYHNYYLQYFPPLNQIYVYKDNFTVKPFTIKLQIILSLQYNSFNQQFYIISKDPVDNYYNIQTFLPTFNCALAKNTITDTSNPFDTNCKCPKEMLFNRQLFQCQNSICGSQQNPCYCPIGTSFNDFNLKCQPDCSKIPNTTNIKSYKNSERCICQSPFIWNTTLSDCSSINCALVNNSASTQVSNSCQCISGFVWNGDFQACIQKSQSSFKILPPIIIIDFQNDTNSNPSFTINNKSTFNNNSIISNNSIKNNNTNLYSESRVAASPVGLIVGLMVFLLLLLGATIYFYYKRCKESGTASETQQQQRQSGPSPTQRNLSEKQKATKSPNAQSDVQLKSVGQNPFQTNNTPQKQEKEEVITENLQNFSIDEDQQVDKDHFFSEIESNIENPLN